MNAAADSGRDVIRVAAEGAPIRRAVAILQRESPALVASLRRSMAFLTRRGNDFAPPEIRVAPLRETLEGLEAPLYIAELLIDPGGSRGTLAMDGTVAAIILDGVLGGDGSAVPKFDPSGLTAAQKALVARVATNIVDNITEALGPSLGLSLRIVPANDDAPDEATPLTCVFEVATGELRGNLVLALAKDAVLTRTKAAALAQVHPPSPKVAAFLETVEVEVIAELGRDRKRLAEVTNLRVGDILRLDVPVNEHVKVRVGNNASFVGEPTAVSGQVAIRFVRWHEDWKPGE